MKIKTSNLTDIAFEWAVAKADGTDKKSLADFARLRGYYAYTTDWAQGGPIIERERIEFRQAKTGMLASYHGGGTWFGKTHLEAAMRAYVALKLGVEVEIPEELK